MAIAASLTQLADDDLTEDPTERNRGQRQAEPKPHQTAQPGADGEQDPDPEQASAEHHRQTLRNRLRGRATVLQEHRVTQLRQDHEIEREYRPAGAAQPAHTE